MKGLLAVLVLLLGCATLQQDPNTVVGHWGSKDEFGHFFHWHFREDGTFEAVNKWFIEGHPILTTSRGVYKFSDRYILAYIHETRPEPFKSLDITFVGPIPLTETGTYEFKDGDLILVSTEGKTRIFYR